MRWLAVVFVAVLASGAVAQVAPPGILKEDCSVLKGKAKRQCEARNAAGDAPAGAAKPADNSDMPTGVDADVPGEPPSPRPAAGAKAAARPDTSDMPTGKDADPPADSMGPLLPDGRPDPRGPLPPPASSSSSSSGSGSSSSSDDDDVAPTTSGSDTPVKAATLKDRWQPDRSRDAVQGRVAARSGRSGGELCNGGIAAEAEAEQRCSIAVKEVPGTGSGR